MPHFQPNGFYICGMLHACQILTLSSTWGHSQPYGQNLSGRRIRGISRAIELTELPAFVLKLELGQLLEAGFADLLLRPKIQQNQAEQDLRGTRSGNARFEAGVALPGFLHLKNRKCLAIGDKSTHL